MTKIQMLSCTSGQRYFRRVSRYTVSVAILAFATLRRVSLGSNYRCWSDIQRKLVMVDLCLANIHRCDCSRDMCYEAIAASDGSAMSFVELRSVLYLRWCAPSLRDVLELQCCSNDLSWRFLQASSHRQQRVDGTATTASVMFSANPCRKVVGATAHKPYVLGKEA